MDITEMRKDDEVWLKVSGKVDTNSGPQLQERILKAFQKAGRLVIDMEETFYVSSAGLRALLIGQKTAESKQGSMRLVHVGDDVMSVLNMSGFVNILTVEE